MMDALRSSIVSLSMSPGQRVQLVVVTPIENDLTAPRRTVSLPNTASTELSNVRARHHSPHAQWPL